MSALKICQDLLCAEIAVPVYPVVAPQTAELPFVVTTLVHEAQDFVIEGANHAFFARIQIAAHGDSPAKADELAEIVKEVLEITVNRTVSEAGIPWAGATFWKEGTDLHDYSDDRSVFRRITDWRLRWWRVP